MALQGDLSSFALPEVLRLLAGTAKSGRLGIDGPDGAGELELADGALVRGRVSAAPNAHAPHEVIYELLRFERGAFSFDEVEVTAEGATSEVGDALRDAEELLDEWRAVEAIVPTMDAWVSLDAEVDADPIELAAAEWRTVAAIGSGASVRDLAAALALTDLATSQQVVALADRGLVAVRASLTPAPVAERHLDGYAPPAIELDSFEEFEVGADLGSHPEGEVPVSLMTDLEHLSADERPVVMEDRDDALLPEPLPGEGVAYDGESFTGAVDGRTFETLEAFESYDLPETTAALEPFQVDRPEDPRPSIAPDPDSAVDDATPTPGGEGDAVPFGPDGEAPDSASRISADDEPPVVPALDDERGSLLRFLSTVKP